MIDAHWPLFLLASLAIIATPGQDMLLVMSKSVTQGMRAGLCAAAGVSLGLVGHTVLATLGLGALLRASEWLFTALKLLGALYLLVLGVQLLRTRRAQLAAEASATMSPVRLLAAGAISNLSNPKVAIFYFAFLPQFMAPNAQHPTLTLLTLGMVYAVLAFVVKGPVALFAGRLSAVFQARPQALLWVYRCSGLVMVGLALRLALARRGEV